MPQHSKLSRKTAFGVLQQNMGVSSIAIAFRNRLINAWLAIASLKGSEGIASARMICMLLPTMSISLIEDYNDCVEGLRTLDLTTCKERIASECSANEHHRPGQSNSWCSNFKKYGVPRLGTIVK